MEGLREWACGLVAMIPALGAGGPGFKSRLAPTLLLLITITNENKLTFYNFALLTRNSHTTTQTQIRHNCLS